MHKLIEQDSRKQCFERNVLLEDYRFNKNLHLPNRRPFILLLSNRQ